jgi:competence protein ComEC
MPLLEQHRRALRDAAPRRLRLIFALAIATLDRHWPLAWGALFMAAGALGASRGGLVLPGWAIMGRAAALLPLALAARRAPARAAVWLAVVVSALAWGAGAAAEPRAQPWAAAPSPMAPSRILRWRTPAVLRVTGFAGPTAAGGWRAPAVVAAAEEILPGGPRRGDGVWLQGEGAAPPAGALIEAGLEFTRPAPAAVPGSFDLQAFLAGRGLGWRARVLTRGKAQPDDGIAATARLAGRARLAVGDAVERLLPPREARMGRAVLLGMRTPASRGEAEAFTDLGLAHLFAVSGLHVGVLVGVLLAPSLLLGAGRGIRAGLLAAALPAYTVLTGAPASVIRAGALVGGAALAAALGRRPDGLRLLGLVVWAAAAWDPATTLDAGFRLSCLAAGGIMAAGRLSNGFHAAGPRPWRAAAAGLGVSVAAQWGTLPVAAAAFGRINAASPLVNLVAVPLFGAAVWLLAAALAAAPVLPGAAADLAAWTWLIFRLLAVGATALGGGVEDLAMGMPPPGPLRVAGWAVASGVLALLARGAGRTRLRRGTLATAACAGLAVFGPWPGPAGPGGSPRVVQFAVGQGDCSLVAFPDGWSGLIDLGDRPPGRPGAWSRDVAPWLARHHADPLDVVVLTHGHRDHTGGAADFAAAASTRLWLGGGRAARADPGDGAPWLRPGPLVRTLHRWRGWRLEVIDPCRLPFHAHGENDASLVAVLRENGAARMVWTGDLEVGGERALLAAGLVPEGADVWKAGHHGSETSGDPAFLDRLRPGLVLVSCGVENRHRHPSHGPYTAAGDTLPVLRTDLHGTIFLRWRRGIPQVEASLAGPP